MNECVFFYDKLVQVIKKEQEFTSETVSNLLNMPRSYVQSCLSRLSQQGHLIKVRKDYNTNVWKLSGIPFFPKKILKRDLKTKEDLSFTRLVLYKILFVCNFLEKNKGNYFTYLDIQQAWGEKNGYNTLINNEIKLCERIGFILPAFVDHKTKKYIFNEEYKVKRLYLYSRYDRKKKMVDFTIDLIRNGEI